MLNKENDRLGTKLHSGRPSSQLSVRESFKATAFPCPFTGFRMPGVRGVRDWRKEQQGGQSPGMGYVDNLHDGKGDESTRAIFCGPLLRG